MKRTTYAVFQTVSSMRQVVQQYGERLRHCLTDWSRMVAPAVAVTRTPQHAWAAPGWGYRRAGMELRSARDVDLDFLIRNG